MESPINMDDLGVVPSILGNPPYGYAIHWLQILDVTSWYQKWPIVFVQVHFFILTFDPSLYCNLQQNRCGHESAVSSLDAEVIDANVSGLRQDLGLRWFCETLLRWFLEAIMYPQVYSTCQNQDLTICTTSARKAAWALAMSHARLPTMHGSYNTA